MDNGSAPIIALVIIIILVIFVVVALSWHPAPVVLKEVETPTAMDLLKQHQNKRMSPSVLSPPRDCAPSPTSDCSAGSSAWAIIERARQKALANPQ